MLLSHHNAATAMERLGDYVMWKGYSSELLHSAPPEASVGYRDALWHLKWGVGETLKVAGTFKAPIGVHLSGMCSDKKSWVIVLYRSCWGDFYVTGTAILTRAKI